MIQSAGAKGEEEDDGFRILEYPAVLHGCLHQQGAGQLEIGAIGHPNPYDDAGNGVAQGPVDQPFGH